MYSRDDDDAKSSSEGTSGSSPCLQPPLGPFNTQLAGKSIEMSLDLAFASHLKRHCLRTSF